MRTDATMAFFRTMRLAFSSQRPSSMCNFSATSGPVATPCTLRRRRIDCRTGSSARLVASRHISSHVYPRRKEPEYDPYWRTTPSTTTSPPPSTHVAPTPATEKEAYHSTRFHIHLLEMLHEGLLAVEQLLDLHHNLQLNQTRGHRTKQHPNTT